VCKMSLVIQVNHSLCAEDHYSRPGNSSYSWQSFFCA